VNFNANNAELRVIERALKYYQTFGGKEASLDHHELQKLINSVEICLISKRRRPQYLSIKTHP
jgi:hypothetical protein